MMKKVLLYTFLLLSFLSQSQDYSLIPDITFGTGGFKTNINGNFYPKNALLINGNYFFISSTTIAKFNYDGTTNTSFGSNGFMTMGNANDVYTIESFKYVNNAIYLFGQIVTGSNTDGFVTKIDENGVFDTGFGTNGISRIDFGTNEILKNFSLDSNGSLYCIGRKWPGDTTSSMRLVYFKLNSNGTLNSSFDSNGYKEFLINSQTEGKAIFPSGNDFLLVGTSTYYVNSTRYQKLLLTKIDANGNIITSFGTNGSTSVELYGGMSINLNDVVLVANKLYVNYFYAWSFSTQGSRILKYNMVSNQVVFQNESYYTTNFQIENEDDLYVVGAYRCTFTPCSRDFLLTKKTASGTPDFSLNGTGDYMYNFPSTSMSDDYATVLIKDSNGKILLGGRVKRTFMSNNQYISEDGFAMMRLVQAPLDVTETSRNKTKIFPNPFTDFVNIETTEPIKEIDLTDINGRILDKRKIDISENSIHLQLPNLNSGIYFIRITAINEAVISEKIIKQ